MPVPEALPGLVPQTVSSVARRKACYSRESASPLGRLINRSIRLKCVIVLSNKVEE